MIVDQARQHTDRIGGYGDPAAERTARRTDSRVACRTDQGYRCH